MAASDIEPTAALSGNSPNSKEKSVSPKKDETATMSDAMTHFSTGKRNLLVQDIPNAVESFALACELFSEQYGETAGECAEAYLYYGKALLEMARLESGVLGNALDGVPEEEGEDSDSSQVEDPEKMTADEKEEVGVKVSEALDENFTKHEETIAKLTNGHAKTLPDEGSTESEGSQDEESQEEGEESQDKEKDSEKEKTEDTKDSEVKEDAEKKETETVEAEKEKDEEKKDTESVGGDDKAKEDVQEQEAEDDEDPSNLQLAWEMLELAKVIFTRKTEEAKDDAAALKKAEDKLCETYLTLGEVSLENENYTQAVEDLTACLKKQQEKLPADSRSIAETHYQLGVALGFQCSFEEATQALKDAIKVLTSRIENLKAGNESKDTTRTDDAFYTKEREISELEKLLPEIQEKIQDTESMKKETIRKMKEEAGFTNGSGSGESSKPVSTIAVKKRKATDDETETSPKKVHLTNGSS